MISEKDMLILTNLRKDARITITQVSEETGIPVSTIFDRLKKMTALKKNTVLLNFEELGYNVRNKVAVKVDNDRRDDLKKYLTEHKNVNSLYETTPEYDFLFETIHRNMKEFVDFTSELEKKYPIQSKQTFSIIDEIKREEFLI